VFIISSGVVSPVRIPVVSMFVIPAVLVMVTLVSFVVIEETLVKYGVRGCSIDQS
jgi:hypothetical protein